METGSGNGNGLAGKTAFITGSARGLGKMTALKLAELGCHVAVSYVHSREEAEALADQIRSTGVNCIAVQGDVAVAGDTKAMIGRVTEELGGVDILVNNAGPFVRERRRFVEYDEAEIEYLIQAESGLFSLTVTGEIHRCQRHRGVRLSDPRRSAFIGNDGSHPRNGFVLAVFFKQPLARIVRRKLDIVTFAWTYIDYIILQ